MHMILYKVVGKSSPGSVQVVGFKRGFDRHLGRRIGSVASSVKVDDTAMSRNESKIHAYFWLKHANILMSDNTEHVFSHFWCSML